MRSPRPTSSQPGGESRHVGIPQNVANALLKLTPGIPVAEGFALGRGGRSITVGRLAVCEIIKTPCSWKGRGLFPQHPAPTPVRFCQRKKADSTIKSFFIYLQYHFPFLARFKNVYSISARSQPTPHPPRTHLYPESSRLRRRVCVCVCANATPPSKKNHPHRSSLVHPLSRS